MVDNELENLKAVSDVDPDKEILLLHAEMIFKRRVTRVYRKALACVEGEVITIIGEEFPLLPDGEYPNRRRGARI